MGTYLEHDQKLKSLERYIRMHVAFTVKDLTKKMNVSRRTILRMIDELRAKDVDVQYCRKRRRYFVEN
jgi:predicted DNA-binding transcriptional regulator YafY